MTSHYRRSNEGHFRANLRHAKNNAGATDSRKTSRPRRRRAKPSDEPINHGHAQRQSSRRFADNQRRGRSSSPPCRRRHLDRSRSRITRECF
ncbi:MAG: hypothetical protein MZU97_25755 [Bacillus subtilis]|nr:hypothetical protein [Bacillus subtilis]